MQRACAQRSASSHSQAVTTEGLLGAGRSELCAGVIREDDRTVDLHSDALCWVVTEIPSEQNKSWVTAAHVPS